MIEEGHDKQLIDSAAKSFGMPMGPAELADQVGLDICLDVAESLGATRSIITGAAGPASSPGCAQPSDAAGTSLTVTGRTHVSVWGKGTANFCFQRNSIWVSSP